MSQSLLYFFFFFNDTATTEIYTLSLHDALPILIYGMNLRWQQLGLTVSLGGTSNHFCTAALHILGGWGTYNVTDRKSTRLNSSHSQISYAVFCLKKKKNINIDHITYTFEILLSR